MDDEGRLRFSDRRNAARFSWWCFEPEAIIHSEAEHATVRERLTFHQSKADWLQDWKPASSGWRVAGRKAGFGRPSGRSPVAKWRLMTPVSLLMEWSPLSENGIDVPMWK